MKGYIFIQNHNMVLEQYKNNENYLTTNSFLPKINQSSLKMWSIIYNWSLIRKLMSQSVIGFPCKKSKSFLKKCCNFLCECCLFFSHLEDVKLPVMLENDPKYLKNIPWSIAFPWLEISFLSFRKWDLASNINLGYQNSLT